MTALMRLRDVDVVTVATQDDGAHRRETWHDGEFSTETWTPRPGCHGETVWEYTVYSDRAVAAYHETVEALMNSSKPWPATKVVPSVGRGVVP